MNDSKRVTQTHTPEEKAHYCALRRRWADMVHSDLRHEFDAADYLTYMALMGRDWRKGFSPIHNPNRLKNGNRPYQAAAQALAIVRISYRDAEWITRFDGLLTPEMLAAMRARLPKVTQDTGDTLPDAPYLEVSDGDAASAA